MSAVQYTSDTGHVEHNHDAFKDQNCILFCSARFQKDQFKQNLPF